MFKSKQADGSGRQRKLAARGDRQAQPTGGERPQEMAVGKQDQGSVETAEAAEQPVGPVRYVGDGFPGRAAVAKQIPARMQLVDFRGGQAFIVAVVPLAEIRLRLGRGAAARERAGFLGSPERAREHPKGPTRRQRRAQLAGPAGAPGGEGKVRPPGVPAGKGPRGLTVADEDDHFGHG